MKKQMVFILFVLSILIIAGCGGGKKPKTPQVGFIGGKEGLVPTLNIISTTQNEVLDNDQEQFQIAIKIQNKGEDTVEANEILTTLTGIDLSAFQIKEPNGVLANSDVLEKTRAEAGKILPTSETQMIYEANYKFDEPTNKMQDIGANICYKYQTTASADACLRKDVTKPSTEARCKIEDQKLVGNSGAPVQVAVVTQRPSAKNKLRFTINIENLGKGEVYNKEFLLKGKCIDDQEAKNKLYLKVGFQDGNPKVQCSRLNNNNEGFVNLIQNKATITCEADTPGLQETTFTKSLITILDYVYKDAVSAKLTIKSVSS